MSSIMKRFKWYCALLLLLGLNSACSNELDEDSSLSIRNGQRVPENGTGPDRVSTVGISTGCSGSIIAEDLILTAAHCISNGAMSVVFRTNMFASGTGDVIPVTGKIIHASYAPSGSNIVPYDIALLKLQRAIPTRYKPVKLLPSSKPLVPGEAVLQAGFGETIVRGGGSFGLLRSVNNNYLGKASYGRIRVANKNFTGTCSGDSGGPLFVNKDGEWFVAGALSGGVESKQYGCHGGGTYTGTAEFSDWILRAAQQLTGRDNPFPANPDGRKSALAACVGVNGQSYSHGTVTIYKNQYFTCNDGNWENGNYDLSDGQCIGVDGKVYDNGVVTLYQGNTYTCQNGRWI